MRLSAPEEYGLRCLVQVTRLSGDEPARVNAIAQAEGLTPEYTAKLMRLLRQKGLVLSVRGAGGGYRLTRPAEEISVWEAMIALDSPTMGSGFCKGPNSGCIHADEDCSLRAMWAHIGSTLQQVLKVVSIADLARSGKHMTEHFAAVRTSGLEISP
ncbi:MAG: Rrf2 family transcriptional regulator [Proteobacteria bacterium]|jgi:Rrf2 family transcriptional regulator, iron-sulfur cluster assembly transcription factor|nr:Rrf2 family transcriptional regulator [Pseudomonadota bacterium]